MIESIGRVMLYVKDPRSVANFWIDKLGFVQLDEQPAPDNTISVEVAPSKKADTSFVLFSSDVIAKYSPELTLGTPSILLSTKNINELHASLKAKGVAVGDIVDMEGMLTFNFPDNENNYFAVRQV